MRINPDKVVLTASAISAVLMYFVLHVQAIDDCHERGGHATHVEDNIVCVDKEPILKGTQ